jgi:hypothetical protein
MRDRLTLLEVEADDLRRQLSETPTPYELGKEPLEDLFAFGEDDSSSSDSDTEQPELPPLLTDPDGEEEEAPDQPRVTAEELAEEAALGAELGFDLTALCDLVEAQITPVQKKICFGARDYVRTLLVCVQRARDRRDNHFVFPPEMENLVCGGATQACLCALDSRARAPRSLLCTQTQAGKTMFVVVGIVAAFAMKLPCVVRRQAVAICSMQRTLTPARTPSPPGLGHHHDGARPRQPARQGCVEPAHDGGRAHVVRPQDQRHVH